MNALLGPALVALGVLATAGVAKAMRPHTTADVLRDLGLPKPLLAARLLGAYEVLLAAGAAFLGSAILWGLVAVSYAGFTIVVIWMLSRGSAVSCGCFGTENTPASPFHVVFNAIAAACSGLMISEPESALDFSGTWFEAVLLTVLVLLGVAVSIAALTELPRTLAAAGGPARAVSTFTVTDRSNR